MFDEALLKSELSFKAVLSGGPGGQHANKVSTKVILEWDLNKTQVFSAAACSRLREKLKSFINKEGILQLSSDETRSQHKNKEAVIRKFITLLEQGLKKPKKRIPTKAGKAYHEKRLKEKRVNAEKKSNRKNPL